MVKMVWMVAGLCLTVLSAFAQEDPAQGVIIVANSADRESVELARYYARAREVPQENIFAFDMPGTESIRWAEFVEKIFNPLREALVEKGWIHAQPREGEDAAGRKRWAITGHRISYMVVCRGVPLKIRNAPELLPAGTRRPTAFLRNDAAVDSELALLAMSDTKLEGFVPNPLYGRTNPLSIELERVVKVSRLDGLNPEELKALIDRTILAENQGLIGRSYVDMGGIHPAGDKWLGALAEELDSLGWDGDVDKRKSVLGVASRFDMPAIYFGWYSRGVRGPFMHSDFRFPPGAIAMHIYSFSANSLRASAVKAQWVQTLLSKGASATFGNVGEPYLELSHQPHMVFKLLADGAPLGDAAYYGLKALSWQAIVIGDPLYRPFKVSFEEQWNRRASLTERQRGYLLLRRMHMLEKSGDRNSAIWTGQQEKNPIPAVIWKVSSLQRAAGDLAGEKITLGKFVTVFRYNAEDAPLAALAAKRLGELGDRQGCYVIWRVVMERSMLPAQMRQTWLGQAKAAALAAGASSQAARWDEEIQKIKAEAEARKAAEAAEKAAGKKS